MVSQYNAEEEENRRKHHHRDKVVKKAWHCQKRRHIMQQNTVGNSDINTHPFEYIISFIKS